MGCCAIIYELNSKLVGMRPGIAMEIGFKNWNRCRMSGLAVDSPLPLFWDCKNSPGLCELDKNCPCGGCLNCSIEWLELVWCRNQ